MNLIVEFYGMARRLTGLSEAPVALEEGADVRALMHALAEQYPALVGYVIQPDRERVTGAYVLNVDGKRAVQDYSLPLNDGERVLILLDAGGG